MQSLFKALTSTVLSCDCSQYNDSKELLDRMCSINVRDDDVNEVIFIQLMSNSKPAGQIQPSIQLWLA